jgi:hypothetical protein
MTGRAIAAGLVIGLLVAGSAPRAQGRLPPDLTTSQRTDQDRFKVLHAPPDVFSGGEIGIRVTGQKGADGRVPGTLVVKIDGKWVDVVTPPMVTTSGR